MILLWLKAAWDWLKRNWMWILLPVGVLVAVARLFKGGSPPVIAPGSVEASRVQTAEREKADAAVQKADEERKAKLEEIEKEHGEALSKLTEEQSNKVAELVDDPDALNDYLLKVSKGMRR